MLAVGLRKPRDIEYAEYGAIERIADHRSRARPLLDTRAEMLRTMDLHRLLQSEGGTDRVGATTELGPVTTRYQPDLACGFNDARVAGQFEDHAVRIREQQNGPRLRKELACLLDKRHAGMHQAVVPHAQVEQSPFLQRRWGTCRIGSHPAIKASKPGIVNDPTQGTRGRLVTLNQTLPRLHDAGVPIRTGKPVHWRACLFHAVSVRAPVPHPIRVLALSFGVFFFCPWCAIASVESPPPPTRVASAGARLGGRTQRGCTPPFSRQPG